MSKSMTKISQVIRRRIQLLQLLKVEPHTQTVNELLQQLINANDSLYQEEEPYTIDRDLNDLKLCYPHIRCEKSKKPYGWSWRKDAPLMIIPPLDPAQSAALIGLQPTDTNTINISDVSNGMLGSMGIVAPSPFSSLIPLFNLAKNTLQDYLSNTQTDEKIKTAAQLGWQAACIAVMKKEGISIAQDFAVKHAENKADLPIKALNILFKASLFPALLDLITNSVYAPVADLLEANIKEQLSIGREAILTRILHGAEGLHFSNIEVNLTLTGVLFKADCVYTPELQHWLARFGEHIIMQNTPPALPASL